MSNKSSFKYLMAIALKDSLTVLKLAVGIAVALSLSSNTHAQVQSNRFGESRVDFQNRLSSPWSNAKLIHTLKSESAINAIAFSPNGKILASVESDRVALWDTSKGETNRILPSHYSTKHNFKIAPTAIAFSADSRFLATATWSQGLLSADRSLMVWDTATGEEVLGLSEAAGCRQVLFDPTVEILYGACESGVTAWSFPQGDKLFSFDLEYPVDAIALSSNGKVIATADANITGGQQGEKSNQIQLWNLDGDEPTLLNTLDGHNNNIAQIEFTADGKKLVSSSYDGKINVWNWQEGKIDRKNNNLHSNNGLFSLSANSRLIAGNFHSSAMTSLVTGLPLRNVMTTLDKKNTKMLAFSPQGEIFAGVKQSVDSDRSEIYLWQNNPESQKAAIIEEEYLPIDIAQYWDTAMSDKQKPSHIGKDPQEVALAAFGLTEIIESEQEQVEIKYAQNDAVVTITQTNLPDDSVTGIRYQVKFSSYGDRTQKLWQVVSAGQQFKCHRNRGHQNWSQDFCL